ncbi:MAG TPA: hypothetical protein VMX13_01640 [Sedimentisphaerales bacterium]|nr:hypothetical protein [Sedimentisphaerales bacterium]
MKKTKLIGVIVLLVAALAAAFVVGDYFEVFGCINADGVGRVGCRFKFRDHRSRETLAGVTVRSYRWIRTYRSSDAALIEEDLRSAFENEPDGEGIVRGWIHIWVSERRTLLFEKYNSLKAGQGGPIEFVFSHPSYGTETRTFTIRQLGEIQTLELTPKGKQDLE